MSRPGYQTSFEPRVRVENEKLIERLRSCNGILPSARVSNIKDILKLAKEDDEDYEAEIERIHIAYEVEMERIRIAYEADTHLMRLRREGLKKYTERLSTFLSPIHHLPSELLLHIFGFCCEMNDLSDSLKPGNASALTISAVSCRWREIALSTPSLWANLEIRLDSDDDGEEGERDDEKLLELVKLFFARSKNHPLTLVLSVFLHRPGHPLLPFIAQQAYRWESVLFRSDKFGGFWSRCLKPLSLPLLKTVNFERLDDLYPTHSPEAEAFKNASNLNTIGFDSTFIDSDTVDRFSAHWGVLTELSYCLTTPLKSFLPVIMDRCPKLRRLGLKTDGDHAVGKPVNPPQMLPLTSLELSNYYFRTEDTNENDALQCMLSSLTLPHLTGLVLEQVFVPMKGPLPKPFLVLDNFLKRSKCLLTTLTLQKICLTDNEVTSLLLQLPSLQELSIEDPLTEDALYHPISTPLIQSLHTWERSPLHWSFEPLVPKLRSLTLRPRTKDFDASSFVSSITSRWLPDEALETEMGAVCMKSVELHLPQTTDVVAEQYISLKQLDKSGMRVVVKWQGNHIV